ncbi:MAG TPA: hypothetical protein VGZ32_10635 [Actinocrinis sp.]|jgi:hypothetical protein|uniref:hypothetical protein n=1 Tax=Actinocrinis sp. TaxID=1920516 RepID=UPI002DDD1587|nr:hypothetical protein [Actinocrinis sp.]HEV3170788.1 hypothetical protein [Actinocrinis sp.]
MVINRTFDPKTKKITSTNAVMLPLLHQDSQCAYRSPPRPRDLTARMEDYAVASSRLAVLLDGATVPPGTASCPHDARWFSRTLGAMLFAELSAEPPVWIAECVARATDAVATSHSKTCEIDDQTQQPSSNAMA